MALWDTNLDPFGRPLTAKQLKKREEQRRKDLARASKHLKKVVARIEESTKNAPPMTDAEEYTLLQVLDQPLMIQKAFIEVTVSLVAGAILSDLSDRCRAEHVVDDWVWVDPDDWQCRLGLSEAERKAALALLKQRQFIQIRDNPHTMMRVDWVNFEKGVRAHAEKAVRALKEQRPVLVLN